MLRVCLNRSVQIRPKPWRDIDQVIFSRVLTQTVVVFFQGQVDYKSYDDCFEPSTLEARHDYGSRLLVALSWTPLEWVTVNVTATIARNESTISTLRYPNFLLSPSLRILFRF